MIIIITFENIYTVRVVAEKVAELWLKFAADISRIVANALKGTDTQTSRDIVVPDTSLSF
jgi:hypothetical protein